MTDQEQEQEKEKEQEQEKDLKELDRLAELLNPQETFFVSEASDTQSKPRKQPKQQLKSQPKQTSIYVSGLPVDITISELAEYFGKAGVIMDDMFKNGPRIKIYREQKESVDSLIVYLREESVDLACTLFDDSQIRPGHFVKVQKAEFDKARTTENEGKADDQEQSLTTESKNKIDKETWKKHMISMKKKLEWFDVELPRTSAVSYEASNSKAHYARIVILRNMFDSVNIPPEDYLMEVKADIEDECKQKNLLVTSVQIYEDQGIISIRFKDRIQALAAVAIMNGRKYDGRTVQAFVYDGSFSLKKKEKTQDLEEEAVNRLERFGEWLEHQDAFSEKKSVMKRIEYDQQQSQQESESEVSFDDNSTSNEEKEQSIPLDTRSSSSIKKHLTGSDTQESHPKKPKI